MNPSIKRLAVSAFVSGGVILGGAQVSTALADEGALARGGKLYDKWYSVAKAEKPKETHKLWPASNDKKKGATTWRCKSCHGWDYSGADGAYKSGSYKTGIKGIRGMAGADTAAIIKILRDDAHKFAGKMDERDLMDLASFVSKGQVDMDTYIDRATKSPKGGDAAKGANYYNTMCAQCHGADGRLPKDMPKSLGALMGNPWEVMHKILNGQPNERMPAMRALDRQVTVDIMAHLATLPKEK